MLQVAILARYFTAADFGDLALVMVVISFSQMFLDMGISNSLIHKQDANHEQLSSLFWFNILSGVVIFCLVTASSSFIADFFRRPELTPLIIIAGLNFIIIPFGQQFHMLMLREFRFGLITSADVIAAVINLVAVWSLAIKGMGVLSVILATLISTLATTCWFIFWGASIHRPELRLRFSEIRYFIRYGLYQTMERAVNYLGGSLDQILIGRILGNEALGIYSLAFRIAYIPIQRLNLLFNLITLPVLARLQDDHERFTHFYNLGMHYLMSIHLPVYFGLYLVADDFVSLYLGSNWESVVVLLRIFCLYGLIKAMINPVGIVFRAIGKVKLSFMVAVFWTLSSGSVLLVSMYFRPELQFIAWIQVFLVISLGSVWHIMTIIGCGISYRELLQSTPRLLAATMVMMAAVSSVRNFGIDDPVIRLTVSVAVGVVVYAAGLRIVDPTAYHFFRSGGRE